MKARLCIFLSLCLIFCALSLPVSAGDPASIELVQADVCEPGQSVVLTLSLPEITLAGGFFSLAYDDSLFTLIDASLVQASDHLTLTYSDRGNHVNFLLDSAQNVTVSGAFLTLTLQSHEEIQPGEYYFSCTVPDSFSFYALQEDGSTVALDVRGCDGAVIISEPILPLCPARYLACQETNPANGTVHVRVCALVEDDITLSRGSYGFTCTVTDQSGTRELTLGGSEITDAIDGGTKIYTAQELGGRIYTSTLQISDSGDVTVSLSPFVRTDGQSLYGGTYTLYYKDGCYQKTTG